MKKRHPITLGVHVREYGGAYIARCNGKQASSTSRAEFAVRSAVMKATGVLQTLGIIGALPNEAEIKLTNHGEGLWEATF